MPSKVQIARNQAWRQAIIDLCEAVDIVLNYVEEHDQVLGEETQVPMALLNALAARREVIDV